MKRLLLCGFAMLVLGPGAASLVAGDRGEPDYYPLKVGNSWEYKVSVGGNTTKVTNVIDKLENINGEMQAFQKSLVNGQMVGSEYLSSNRSGVFRHKANGIASVPPVQLLKYPIKVGEAWEMEHVNGGVKNKIAVKVGEYQEIQVAAGKYKAITITLTTMDKGMNVNSTYWFAPNVGFVKQTALIGNINVSLELEKFEMGK